MEKKRKPIKIVLLSLLFLILAFIGFRVFMFYKFGVRNLKITNDNVSFKLPKHSTPTLIDVKPDSTPSISEINDIKILINNKAFNANNKILLKALRYYLCIDDLVSNNIINNTNYFYNVSLRNEIINYNNKSYICLNDIENSLSFRSSWDYNNKTIYMFNDTYTKLINIPTASNAKIALLRLEDFCPNEFYGNSDNLEKVKIMTDYLYSNGIKFHVGWIPHFVDPTKNIDKDFTKSSSICDVHFINTLDHFIFKGGIIGLHGYTHQYDNGISGLGIEFNKKINTSENDIKLIAENAIKTAKYLNIPYTFFESPHYKATRAQQKVLENYFSVLYEPISNYFNLEPMFSPDNKGTLYVPTPLDYVSDDGSKMLTRLNLFGDKVLSSIFYHGFKEFNSIKLDELTNGSRAFEYTDNSPLKRIINYLNSKNYHTAYVTEFAK